MNRLFGVDWAEHRTLEGTIADEPDIDPGAYFAFAIVRNPWARLYSDYNYQRRKSRGIKLHIHGADGRARGFSDWVEAVFDDPHAYDPKDWGGRVEGGMHRWSPQVDWISLEGEISVDFVARIESIQRDIQVVAERVGLDRPVRLPRRNWRPHWPYWTVYSRDLIDRVGAYYERDIEAFGYDFL